MMPMRTITATPWLPFLLRHGIFLDDGRDILHDVYVER